MALKAVETLLLPWGWDVEKMMTVFELRKKKVPGGKKKTVPVPPLQLFD